MDRKAQKRLQKNGHGQRIISRGKQLVSIEQYTCTVHVCPRALLLLSNIIYSLSLSIVQVYSDVSDTLRVVLLDTNGDRDININESLVTKGIAVPIQEGYQSKVMITWERVL